MNNWHFGVMMVALTTIISNTSQNKDVWWIWAGISLFWLVFAIYFSFKEVKH